MVNKIKRYFELKGQVEALNNEATAIRDELKAMFGGATVDVTVDDQKVRGQVKVRANKRCDWSTFKALNDELYAQVVTESSTEYFELRKIVVNG